MSRLPDPVVVRCDRCQRRGRYRLGRFYEIAGTTNGPHARLTFAAAMGCQIAAEQAAGRFRPGFEVCAIVYEGLTPVP